jgi:hypothetical protein
MKAMLLVGFALASVAFGGALGFAPPVSAQDKPGAQNLYYDIYIPSQRLRTRRDNCLADEDMAGAYCVKKCEKDFVSFGNGHPPRCRSVAPLAPGRMPSAIRTQTGTQPLPPGTPPPPAKNYAKERDPNKQ